MWFMFTRLILLVFLAIDRVFSNTLLRVVRFKVACTVFDPLGNPVHLILATTHSVHLAHLQMKGQSLPYETIGDQYDWSSCKVRVG